MTSPNSNDSLFFQNDLSRVNIGKIEIVPIREAFKHEAHNFTRWLADNINALSDRIGMQLAVLEREKWVGTFKVDLFCEDREGHTVIIENQLERTDHDHLGKLLTYMVNLEAKTAIWIATEVQPEHQRVIDWLNASTPVDVGFYFIKVEAVRIENSPYAPLFTVLVRPDEQTREIAEEKKDLAERHILRQSFWTLLLERSKGKTQLASNRSPSRDHWLSVSLGRSGINYNYLIFKNGSGLDLYIDVDDQEKNKAIFDALYADKEQIERDFGQTLKWLRLDTKRACRIVCEFSEGSLRDQEQWIGIVDRLIDRMILFDQIFRKRILKLADK